MTNDCHRTKYQQGTCQFQVFISSPCSNTVLGKFTLKIGQAHRRANRASNAPEAEEEQEEGNHLEEGENQSVVSIWGIFDKSKPGSSFGYLNCSFSTLNLAISASWESNKPCNCCIKHCWQQYLLCLSASSYHSSGYTMASSNSLTSSGTVWAFTPADLVGNALCSILSHTFPHESQTKHVNPYITLSCSQISSGHGLQDALQQSEMVWTFSCNHVLEVLTVAHHLQLSTLGISDCSNSWTQAFGGVSLVAIEIGETLLK
ncbi:hypothetical protein [Caudoviricetes sp.]|nr:hypothetical protein [Caudoviricetes sp.]